MGKQSINLKVRLPQYETPVKSYFSCKKEKAWYHAVIVSFTFFFVTG